MKKKTKKKANASNKNWNECRTSNEHRVGHRKDRDREKIPLDGAQTQVRGKTFLIEFECDMQAKRR